MKTLIIKITSILSLLLISLFCISTPSVYAASSSYDLATYFTFSSDMDIDEGFDLIKPFILYYNENPSTAEYTFNYESLGNDRYNFTGTFPDGTNYSISTTIRIIENASGTYVEALMTEPYRQSIYVKSLNEGKTTNDCLMECWRNRFVYIKDPTYSIQDSPTQNIYTHMTTIENVSGTYNMLYYAIIENVNYTPDDDQSDNATNNDSNSDTNNGNTDDGSGDIILPDDEDSSNNDNPSTDTDNPSNDNPSTDNNNNDNDTNDDSSSGNNDNQSSQKPSGTDNNDNLDKNNTLDQIKVALIITGSVIGIVLLYLLYLAIKAVIVWLKG